MSRTIVGIFQDRQSAEYAAHEIKKNGLKIGDISLMSKQSNIQNTNSTPPTDTSPQNTNQINDNISDGVVTGSVIGGTAGLLIGIGTIIVPGLGVIAAAGPIVGLLSGTIAGGVIGGMIDLGIDEESGKKYSEDIKSGKTFLSMQCEDKNIERASTILRTCGALNVELH